MTTLDERERAFEGMFAHDEELRFRVQARRPKLLAAWACERTGLFGTAAESYAQSFMTTSASTLLQPLSCFPEAESGSRPAIADIFSGPGQQPFSPAFRAA
jgi:hypothetical protein